jgi:hypothetical protein
MWTTKKILRLQTQLVEVVAVKIVHPSSFQLPIQHGLTTIKDVALTKSVQRTAC